MREDYMLGEVDDLEELEAEVDVHSSSLTIKDHRQLTHRDEPDQHPPEAISGLVAALLYPSVKTAEDTQEVRRDADGKLWTKQGGGLPTIQQGTGANAEVFNGLPASAASGSGAHAEGYRILEEGSTASGDYSHAEGSGTASGQASHAEGVWTEASGVNAHAEGNHATASGRSSHAEGEHTTASGRSSHAEGEHTTASGNYSHAEGLRAAASGVCAHAEGIDTTASGEDSHSGGCYSVASGNGSFAHGEYVEAGSALQAVFGGYNHVDSHGVFRFLLGNGYLLGTSQVRSNAFGVKSDGDVVAAGDVYANSTPNWDVTPSANNRLVKKSELDAAVGNIESALNAIRGVSG